MKQYLFMLGTAGAKALQGLIFGLFSSFCVPENIVKVIGIDTANDAQWAKCRALAESCGIIASSSKDDGAKSSCIGSLSSCFEKFPQTAQGKKSVEDIELTETERLLCKCLLTKEEMQWDVRNGFNCNLTAAEIYYTSVLRQWKEKENGVFSSIVQAAQEIAQGNKVQILMCGNIAGGTGAALFKLLPEWITGIIKQQTCNFNPSLIQFDGVVILPHYGEKSNWKTADRMGMVDWSKYCHVYAVGLPYGRSCSSVISSNVKLCDALASAMVMHALKNKNEPNGLYCYGVRDGNIEWSSFTDNEHYSEKMRLCFGKMYKAAFAYLNYFSLNIENPEDTEKKIFRKSKNNGWYSKYFSVDGADTAKGNETLKTLCSYFMEYVKQLQLSLPADMRFCKELGETAKLLAINYSNIIDKYGDMSAMKREADISGANDIKAVHRYDTVSTEDEKLCEEIDNISSEIQKLYENHKAFVNKTGGAVALKLIKRFLREYSQKYSSLLNEEKEAEQRIETAEAIAWEGERYKIAAARSKLSFMQGNIYQLKMQKEKIEQDIENMLKSGMDNLPPEIGINRVETDKPDTDIYGESGIFGFSLLKIQSKLQDAKNDKDKRQIYDEMWNKWAECVCASSINGSSSDITLEEVLHRLSLDETNVKNDFYRFYNRLMELCMCNGAAVSETKSVKIQGRE